MVSSYQNFDCFMVFKVLMVPGCSWFQGFRGFKVQGLRVFGVSTLHGVRVVKISECLGFQGLGFRVPSMVNRSFCM